MKKNEPSLEELRSLDRRITSFRRYFKKNSSPSAKGAELAECHLECIAKLRSYWDQLDAILGYELGNPELEFEENVPRMSTALRMLGELSTMILGHTDALLNCAGGTAAVGIQALSVWASQEPRSELFLRVMAEALSREKRSRK